MARDSIIRIDYSLTIVEMMKSCGIENRQIRKIDSQLGGLLNITFKHKTPISFKVHDFNFNEPTWVDGASTYISKHNPKSKWKPFDIEHLIHYYQLDPNQGIFTGGLVYSSKRKFLVDGVNHVFVLENRNGHPDLELSPDDHPRAAHLSTFPGQRKIEE